MPVDMPPPDQKANVAVTGKGQQAEILVGHLHDVGASVVRWKTEEISAESLRSVAAVMITADTYPVQPVPLSAAAAEALDTFVRRGGGVYAEFTEGNAQDLFVRTSAELVVVEFERLVVPPVHPPAITLPVGSILESHRATIQAMHPDADDLCLLGYARVAGLDTVSFGLPTTIRPALIHRRRGRGHFVQAATALSQHRAGRYKPTSDWDELLRDVIALLVPESSGRTPAAPEPAVAAPAADQPNPRDAPGGPSAWRSMVDRAASWFERSGVLLGAGDGRDGVAEGFESAIDVDGRQKLRAQVRGDCYIETADALDRYADLTESPRWRAVSQNLTDLVAGHMQVTDGTPRHGRWETRGYVGAEPSSSWVFPDDDGMITFHVLALAHRLRSKTLLTIGLRSAEALTRSAAITTGAQPTMNVLTLLERGVEHYSSDVPVPDGFATSPHYQSAPQAALLLAHLLTGDPRYREVGSQGLDHVLDALPNIGIVTSRTEEYARLLLPVAAAVQATDQRRYRDALTYLTDFLAARQDPGTGAIDEWDGHHPRQDADYGTRENSVFSGNGDRITDQLYTTGFLATNLWIAGKIAGDERLIAMHARLLDYLSRIQIRSSEPTLDGAWLRSFDHRRWEYHGSNADIGWGPYAVETGWSVAPMMNGAVLRLIDDPMLPVRPWDEAVSREVIGTVRAEADLIVEPSPPPRPNPDVHFSFDDAYMLGADRAGGEPARAVGRYAGWVAHGVVAGALLLTQAGPHVSYLESGRLLELQPPLTLAVWVHPHRTTAEARRADIVTVGDYGLRITGGVLKAILPGTDLTCPTSLPAESWSHIAVTLADDDATLWLNGHRVATGSLPAKVSQSPAPMLIGAGGDGRELFPFSGMLDELTVTKAVVEPDVVELDLWRSPC